MSTLTETPTSVYEIRHRWTGAVLFSIESGSFRLAVEAAVAAGADLRDADLRDADLRGATLRGADLRAADLTAANLTGANLRGANLTGANLRGANLMDANLTAADLTAADLTAANLTGANLMDANLAGANLRGANLMDANLTAADLTAANLTGANLRGANLQPIRDDLWAVLCGAPQEVPGLRQALIEGRIDGSTYSGPCACLVGTLANVRGCTVEDFPLIRPNSARPIERWFLRLHPGDTPETSEVARLTLEWTDTWHKTMQEAFGAPVNTGQQE